MTYIVMCLACKRKLVCNLLEDNFQVLSINNFITFVAQNLVRPIGVQRLWTTPSPIFNHPSLWIIIWRRQAGDSMYLRSLESSIYSNRTVTLIEQSLQCSSRTATQILQKNQQIIHGCKYSKCISQIPSAIYSY